MASKPLVLLLASKAPPPARLTRLVRRLRGAGARIALATQRDLAEAGVALDDAQVHTLAAAAEGHGPAFRRALRAAQPAERHWVHVVHDPWVAEKAKRAVAVLALDPRAGEAARRLAGLHPHLTVATSVEDAVSALDHEPRRFLRKLISTARRGARFTRGDGYLAARESALGLLKAGDQAAAEDVVRRALPKLNDPRERADLLGDLTSATLAAGASPGLLRETVAAELAIADEHLAEGRHAQAATAWEEAMRSAFHRVVHLDGLTSPLAAAPGTFTAVLRDSAVTRALQAPRGRVRTDGGDLKGSERPVRVMLTTWANANFLGELREYLGGNADVEVRYVDLKELAGLASYARTPSLIAEEILGGSTDLADLVAAQLGHDLGWADVVFMDWCTVTPALLTAIDPGDTKVVVRLHSVEAFTLWPQLVDFSRVDELVFVSEHLRDLVLASVPGLRLPGAATPEVIPLALDLGEYSRPKKSVDARFTLGLVGWSAVAKDPRWALEVLQQLRARDDRYRLLLFGDDFDSRASRAAESYATQLWPMLHTLEEAGAVVRRGRTDDVPGALQEVGVFLSSSVREGCHTAVMEGAASGAVPVVRDWPFFAGKPNGASTLFPAEWVVATPEQAAARILEVTDTKEAWRQAADGASAEAFRRWDWEQVRRRYDRLLLGEAPL